MTDIFNSGGGEAKSFGGAARQFIFFTLLLFTLPFAAPAQTAPAVAQADAKINAARADATPAPGSNDEMQSRVKQLEAQVQAMQSQIDALKSLINQTQKTPAAAAGAQTETKTPVAAATEGAKPAAETSAKADTKPAQQQPQRQLGVDLGPARLTPYGTIYFNAFGSSGGTNNADVPLFATTASAGVSNASISVRQTRLGLRLEGARLGNARLGGVVEADFFGGFPNTTIGENFGIVRLRLANARLDWEKTSLTVGQDWMVFAPNNPVSLAAAAIPQLAAAGNPWARLPQVKAEHRFGGGRVTWQGAVLAPQTGDYPTASNFFLQPNSGAASRVPFFQTRLAVGTKNLWGTKKPGSVGLSAHYGRSRVFTGASANVENDLDSLGVALDWSVPLHNRFTVAGEAFWGRNLGGFQAGVYQGYTQDFARLSPGGTLTAGGVRGIATRGGWAQVGFTPPVSKDRLSLYASLGLDNPHDGDLINTARRDLRTRNLVYALDLVYKFTPQLSFGAEFRRLHTDYLNSGRRNANHFNLGAAYSF